MGANSLLFLDSPYDYLMSVFETEIRNDPKAAAWTYLTGISAYGPNPLNLGIQAPTSEGKTHPIVRVLKHFPPEDVWFLGTLSPAALRHQRAILIDDKGANIGPALNKLYRELEKEKDSDRKVEITQEIETLRSNERYLIDLRGKIIVFLEPPHPEVWAMLKPILSHDVWRNENRIAEQVKSGKYETKLILLQGWPACIFCSAKTEQSKEAFWAEIASRFLTISPTMGAAKYRAAIEHSSKMMGLPGIVTRKLIHSTEHEMVTRYIHRVRDYWQSKLGDSTSEPENLVWNPYQELIGSYFPANAGRNMRDAPRFMSTMNTSALAFPFHRPRLKINTLEYIIVVREDFEHAKALFFSEENIQTILTGLSAHILDFFEQVMKPLCFESSATLDENRPVKVAELVRKYRAVNGKSLGSDTIRQQYLSALASLGYVDREKDPEDGRSYLWRILISEKNQKSPILAESSNFTLDQFKEAYSKLQRITDWTGRFASPYDDPLTPEQVYEHYFEHPSTNRHAQSVINSSIEVADSASHGKKSDDSGNIGHSRLFLLTALQNLQFKDPEDYVKYLISVTALPEDQAKQFIQGLIATGKIVQYPDEYYRLTDSENLNIPNQKPSQLLTKVAEWFQKHGEDGWADPTDLRRVLTIEEYSQLRPYLEPNEDYTRVKFSGGSKE